MRQIGFHSSCFSKFSVDRTARILGDLGYGAIELNLETCPAFTAHVTPQLSQPQRRELLRCVAEVPLAISSLNAHRPLIGASETAREEGLAFVLGSIDLAADLGAGIVHLISGVLPDGVCEADGWDRLTRTVTQAVKYGRTRGIKVAFEAAVFPGFLVWNLRTLEHLFERVGEPDLYVNFDPSHFLIAGDDVVATFRQLRARIVHMHAKDACGQRGAFQFPALGDGNVNWRALAKAMTETGYEGCLSVEYEAHIFATGYAWDPPAAAKQSKAFLDVAMAPWLDGDPGKINDSTVTRRIDT